MKELKVPGVYAIINEANGKVYVGSAVDMWERWQRHTRDLSRDIHHSPVLQNAWNKYSPGDFRYLVLEHLHDRRALIEREQFWMDSLKPAYNTLPASASRLGHKASKETRVKQSAAMARRMADPVAKAAVSAQMLARWSDPAYRLSTSEASRVRMLDPATKNRNLVQLAEARTKRTWSAKVRENMAAAQRGKKHSAEHRSKISVASSRRMATPSEREKLREAARGRVITPELREIYRAAADKRWAQAKEK